jgi:membrane protease YdiL (CAAX protease family)
MKNKILVIFKSILWCLVILLFPIISGALSVIFSLDTVITLFLQGTFMVMALIPPAIFVFSGKWHWSEIGFKKMNVRSCKRGFYFIPLLMIFIPVAVKGFYVKSIGYVFGSLFLHLFVGISEEIYFRGIIPRYLKEEFSTKGILIVSTFIFAIGHIATAFTANNVFEIALTVLNALIFGWLAMEITIVSSNIIPAILLHFLFDFETKIAVMNGRELLMAESVRGTLMFIIACWLSSVIYKKDNL